MPEMEPIFEIGFVSFDDTDVAVRVLDGLRARGAGHLVNEVAALEHHRSGRFSVHSYAAGPTVGEHMAVGAAVGGLVGMLIGPFGVVLGAAGGTAVGASFGGRHPREIGLDDEFIATLKASLPPGTSAVIVMGEPETVDQLVHEISSSDVVTRDEFRHPLTEEQSRTIRGALEHHRKRGA
jgi:uncharacterized membrane protein